MAFKPNDQCYGHVHEILYLNESILCKNVRFSMVHNVAQGSFQLYFTKNTFFNFRVLKRGLFVKHLPRIWCKMVWTYFCKIVYHMLSANHQLVASQKLSSHLLSKRQIWADSLEGDKIWTTSASLVDHDFFQKSFLSSKHVISMEIY